MVETGMPPMAARVLVCLLTSDTGSHTAAELAHRLRVSPASISKAVGQLEPMGILTREREGPRRRERYIIHDDVWYHTWTASIRSMARWAGIARQGVGVLGSATPAGTRLDRASRFFQLLCQDMAEAAERRRLDVTVMERPE
ncbi:MarR family transcriptional regulator [Thermocatellispora tengchongensis]